MPEWILKRKILHRSIVQYEITYRKNKSLNLETHLAFVDYGEAFGKVKIDKLFEILHSKNIPNLFLKSVTEIYSGNKNESKDKQ